MKLYMFTGMLLLVLGVDCGATERCPAPGGTSFKLSITSLRNLTGHWIVSFTGMLLLVLGVDCGATERCPAPGGTSFKLSITSLRNLTGHWIVSVDGVTELPRQATRPNSPVEVAIDVGHGAVSCEQTETVRLTATAVAAVRGVTETPPHSTAVDYVTAVTSDIPPDITDTTSQAPPAGYEVVNGLSYYKMHTNALTWEQAREKCVQEGAHLIIINSYEEAEVATTLLKRDRSKIQGAYGTAAVLAGFHDSATEGKYTTVLGEPLSSAGYWKWYTWTPHNDTERNYGAIYDDGDLSVMPGDLKYAFICELIAQ